MLVAILVLGCCTAVSALFTAVLANTIKSNPRVTYAGVYSWAVLTTLLAVTAVILAIIALKTIPSPHG